MGEAFDPRTPIRMYQNVLEGGCGGQPLPGALGVGASGANAWERPGHQNLPGVVPSSPSALSVVLSRVVIESLEQGGR